ncbi:hypothetical protein [Mycobacterium sp. SMC-4]|uniref:hypothetical protein n=1 Tax=Mycobacterium sp. SMC-4 TaxID=2857059 RepID=UPI0021B15A31|nr:hypothetical protein [Mycobacterium sp. SMC-4]UXA16978.1 hypothetical protein KXD98_19775 [Mycobacterium sp. SMC-4]
MTSPKLTAAQRHQRAKIAANTRWAQTPDHASRLAVTQPGRDAAERRFADLVDPDRKLSETERAKAIRNAKAAHFQQLAFRASRARQRRGSAS